MSSALLLTLNSFLILGCSLFPIVWAEPIHMPLAQRKIPHVIDLNNEALRLRQRYRTMSTASTPVGRRATIADIPIVDLENGSSNYLATISIGTPPQTLNVALDTGSSDLWIIGDGCVGCSSSTPTFQSNASSTFTDIGGQIQLTSGSVSAQGITITDTVQMGSFTVQEQVMIQVQTASSTVDGISGALGLGFRGSSLIMAAPFWEALISGSQLASPEFAIYLRRAPSMNSRPDNGGGVLTLGGTNTTLFIGDIDFVDIPSTELVKLWLLSLTSLTLDGNNITISSGNNSISAIDTGTPLIGGPSADIKAFWDAVPNSTPSPTQQGFFNFPCNQSLSVSMSFGGKSWPISAQDINIGSEKNDTSRCIGAIFDLSAEPSAVFGDSNPGWVIGDAFLKNVYSVFRAEPPSIGFSELAPNIGGSNSVNTTSTPAQSPSSVTAGGQSDNSKHSDASGTSATVSASVLSALMSAILLAIL